MRSRLTTLADLLSHRHPEEPTVERIEIPLIQRDYAQGRTDARTTRIRRDLLDVLHGAAAGGEPVGLDFVYGEVTDGTFRPLDGQQRLTTLFLLHWYVASLTGRLDAAAGWAQLSYATRPSARRFCERLVQHPLPAGTVPSEWLTDRPWYLFVWRDDPTVQSMLVMLDDIHARFADDDLDAVWERLVDPEDPAISFERLLIDDMGSAEDLYIKMNSRGRALTDFEAFKAQLLRALDASPRAAELAERLDGRWSDVMWLQRGSDSLFDDQYLNYIRFVVQLCEWRRGGGAGAHGDLLSRAESHFALDDPSSAQNIDLLFDAFDIWVDASGGVVDSRDLFEALLTTEATRGTVAAGQVAVFGDLAQNLDLFRVCCASRALGSRRALLLYAVMTHLIHATDDVARRLRVVRNLIEASANEIRAEVMPQLLADVERLIVDGDLDADTHFNTQQLVDERAKRDLLADHPDLAHDLFRLEDHPILRGCLMAFELDAVTFRGRADAFHALFEQPDLMALTGALLALGDYSRTLSPGKHRFGSPSSTTFWRELLAPPAPTRTALARTRAVLGELLDRVDTDGSVPEQLAAIQRSWLAEREEAGRFDWRYYVVRYAAMRQGASGIYATSGGRPGHSLCMLEGSALHGYYRDPYLLAVATEAGLLGSVVGTIQHRPGGPWFTGPASQDRWMRLKASNTAIRSDATGFVLQPPPDPDHQPAFREVCARHRLDSTGDEIRYEVPAVQVEDAMFDTVDRIQAGAVLLADLVRAGL